ncbi:Atrial natriuretic peptide receptor 1 [Halotydeus destructor]|nr:Atrial natriuretic peptide receptor 1 [Halotydeus destructor]
MFLITCLILSLASYIEAEKSELYTVRIVGIFVAGSELPYTLELAQPSVEIAIEKARAKFSNIRWLEPSFRNGSSRCTSNYAGVYAAEEFYKDKVTAFIGPACGLALDPVARMAAHWNIPVFTSGGFQNEFSRKDTFRTLTRLSTSLEKMGTFLRKVLDHFNWTHVAILVHETSEMLTLIHGALQDALDQADTISYESIEIKRSLAKVNLTRILLDAAKEFRIFVIVASGSTLRKILLTAHDLGMGNGQFAFIGGQLFRNTRSLGNFYWFEHGDPRNEDAKKIYQSLLLMSVRMPMSIEHEDFVRDVVDRSKARFNLSYEEDDVNSILGGFHDSVLLYGHALNESLTKGEDPDDGHALMAKLRNRTFDAFMTGDIYINANGDRDTNFVLRDLDPLTLTMVDVFTFYGKNDTLVEKKAIYWQGGKGPPSSVPLSCLMADPECWPLIGSPAKLLTSLAGIIILLATLTVGVALIVRRKIKFESELNSYWWRVRAEDIFILEGSEKSFDQNLSQTDSVRVPCPLVQPSPLKFLTVQNIPVNGPNGQNYLTARKGMFKGMKVAIKPVAIRRLSLSRNLLIELKQLRDICHENLIRFIGLCPDDGNIAILTEFSQKGNLRELLDNEAFKMDWPFRFSLISDILEGLIFIHNSPLSYHGRLKSTNCVVDRRLVIKLTDFGLKSLLTQTTSDAVVDARHLLWTAPEHLRQRRPEIRGSVKGDLYSFAIVLQEIVTRTGPFETCRSTSLESPSCFQPSLLDPREIIQRIKQTSDTPYRPEIPEDECPPSLLQMIKSCWEDSPAARPPLDVVKGSFKRLAREMATGNFLESLLLRMEQYANDLEHLVEQKTAAMLEEKRKCEQLLYEVLPRSVAEQLKAGTHVRPETFKCVTVYFSDILEFPSLVEQSSPIELVQLLNELYSCFDSILSNFDVYKVETIGDAYMVVSGLPVRNGPEHVREIAQMALALRDAVSCFEVRHKPGHKLGLRAGIHSGQCAAGVVGMKMPRYCLFGDTVNTASRMETTSEAMKIHVSEPTKKLLDVFGTFELTLRGDVLVKGKGKMTTHWLESENISLSVPGN